MKQYFLVTLIILSVNMSATAKVEPLEFRLRPVEKRFGYCGDFELIITNSGTKSVTLKYFEGPPFKMTYIVNGQEYLLVNKLDQYAEDNGASRAPHERVLNTRDAFSFFVDLSGDFVVRVAPGDVRVFREFAIGKSGNIRFTPNDSLDFKPTSREAVIKVAGVHPLLK